jgi:hypothetical protein
LPLVLAAIACLLVWFTVWRRREVIGGQGPVAK